MNCSGVETSESKRRSAWLFCSSQFSLSRDRNNRMTCNGMAGYLVLFCVEVGRPQSASLSLAPFLCRRRT